MCQQCFLQLKSNAGQDFFILFYFFGGGRGARKNQFQPLHLPQKITVCPLDFKVVIGHIVFTKSRDLLVCLFNLFGLVKRTTMVNFGRSLLVKDLQRITQPSAKTIFKSR